MRDGAPPPRRWRERGWDAGSGGGALRAMGLRLLASGPRLRSREPAQRHARRFGGILGDDKKQSGGTLGLGLRAECELGMVSQCGDPGLLSAGVPA